MAGVYTLQSLVGGLMNAGLPTFLRGQGLDAIGLSGPFLIDQGFAMSQTGVLASTCGFGFSLLSIVTAGLAIKKWHARRVLHFLICLQLIVFSGFYYAATHAISELFLQCLYVILMSVLAASFVTLYTLMMDWVSLRQPGLDFTLFQSTDMLIGVLAGMTSGVLAEHFGYEVSFMIAVGSSMFALTLFSVLLKSIHRKIQQGTV